jgi:hypothetical protein
MLGIIVTALSREVFRVGGMAGIGVISRRGRGRPRRHRLASESAKRAAGDEVALDVDGIVHGSMDE